MKPVLVSVYVVNPNPRRRIESANGDNRHQRYKHYVNVHRQGSGTCYNRKAVLLSYSQQLRAAARRGLASPRASFRRQASLRRQSSPRRRQASPRRGQASPRRGQASPRRGSPARTKTNDTVIVPLINPSSEKSTNPTGDWKKTSKKGKSISMKKFQASMNRKMKAMMKTLRPKKTIFLQGFLRLLFICRKPK